MFQHFLQDSDVVYWGLLGISKIRQVTALYSTCETDESTDKSKEEMC
jgi:hypothetical protein